jgi:hypothetical protein
MIDSSLLAPIVGGMDMATAIPVQNMVITLFFGATTVATRFIYNAVSCAANPKYDTFVDFLRDKRTWGNSVLISLFVMAWVWLGLTHLTGLASLLSPPSFATVFFCGLLFLAGISTTVAAPLLIRKRPEKAKHVADD